MRNLWIFLLLIYGCGYTFQGLKELDYETIYVPPFKNKIMIQQDSPEYKAYYPGLEIELTNILRSRFIYDGSLRLVNSKDKADLVLLGDILEYERQPLRYASNEDVQEFRVRVRTRVRLIGPDGEIWKREFSGDATYIVSGRNAKTEAEAVKEALKELAREIVDKVVLV
jgi:hypothetical protein